jgi:prefoldin subunit 5
MVGRRGKKRTIVAIGHTILTIAYHLIKDKKRFVEIGSTYQDEQKRENAIKYHQKILRELGVEIPEIQRA